LGEGSEIRAPLAATVVGGVIASTLLTLVVVPTMYTLLDGMRSRFARKLTPVAQHVEPVERDGTLHEPVAPQARA
jgi:HAE1 family hydrophobic/amphiphilic exporter-1